MSWCNNAHYEPEELIAPFGINCARCSGYLALQHDLKRKGIHKSYCAEARGEIRTETIEYRHGDVVLEGYVAYDEARHGKLPGVIIVHEWNGIGPYVKKRALQLASLGYAAFCIDIYGKGVRPTDMT
ncbi:MAG: dienelactone hydrolase family protein [Vulcanimicrobiota bacterium]